MPYDDSNVFAKILRGSEPCYKVYEDSMTLAFLDIMPQIEGHTLVIPKEKAITIYDLSEQACLACMRTVQVVSRGLEKAVDFKGSTIFQHNGEDAGQTVPHFHFHVLPGSFLDTEVVKGHATELADCNELEKMSLKVRMEISKLS